MSICGRDQHERYFRGCLHVVAAVKSDLPLRDVLAVSIPGSLFVLCTACEAELLALPSTGRARFEHIANRIARIYCIICFDAWRDRHGIEIEGSELLEPVDDGRAW